MFRFVTCIIPALLFALSALVASGKAPPVTDGNELFGGKKGAHIPLLYEPPFIPLPIIYLQIGEHAPLPFLLDTGSVYPLILSPKTVKILGLQNKVETAPQGSVGTIDLPEVKIATSNTLSNGERQIRFEISAVVESIVAFESGVRVDKQGRQAIAGILGIPLFASLTARIDLPNRTLQLIQKAHPPLTLPNAVTFVWEASPQKHEEDYRPFIDLIRPGNRFLLDTGSSVATLNRSGLRMLSCQQTPFTMGFTVFAQNKRRQSPLYFVTDFPIKGNKETAIEATVDEDLDYSVLGTDFLERFVVVLDPRNRHIHFQPQSKPSYYQTPGISDISLVENLSVEKTTVGSAAHRAGLRPGDRIVAVDGLPVADLTSASIKEMLANPAEKPLKLTIERQGEQQTLTFIRYPLSWFAERHTMGVTWEIRQDISGGIYQAFVTRVVSDSLGARADLGVGDEIVSVNGALVSKTDWGNLMRLWNDPKATELRLEVVRRSQGKQTPEDVVLVLEDLKNAKAR